MVIIYVYMEDSCSYLRKMLVISTKKNLFCIFVDSLNDLLSFVIFL